MQLRSNAVARFPARESSARATTAQAALVATKEVCYPVTDHEHSQSGRKSVQTAQSDILIGHDFILSDLAPGLGTRSLFNMYLEAQVSN